MSHHHAEQAEIMELEEAEVSIEDAFALALTDDTLHDITLQSTDLVEVSAIRSALALRSKVFRKMLYGNFQEATKYVVKVNYPGAVVKAVVQYIHTNTADILVEPDPDDKISMELDLPDARREEFQTLLVLAAAAAYYNLPTLGRKVKQCLSSHLKSFPLLSYTVAEACLRDEPKIPEAMEKKALVNIARHVHGASNDYRDLPLLLSDSTLKSILCSDKMDLPQFNRFKIIQLWYSPDPTSSRQSTAKILVKDHVHLDLIDPDFLSTSVTSSGLVTTEQLCQAYQRQAKRAKHEHNVSFCNRPKPVSNPTFKSTESAVLSVEGERWKGDVIQCPALHAGGTYQWKVQISEQQGIAQVWLGVMSSSAIVMPLRLCGQRKQSWGIYGYKGQEWSSGKKGGCLGDSAKFERGSSVTVTLDLSPGEINQGSLSISVDGKPTVLVSGDMSTKLNGFDGFVPTVSCFGATVTILSMTQSV